MPAVFRDFPNATLEQESVTIQTVTQTTTGTDVDMINGDGRCVLHGQVKATSLTALTVRVQQSTLTNSGFADITGASVSGITADGPFSVSFDRDQRYLQAVVTISGTTAIVGASFFEAKKVY